MPTNQYFQNGARAEQKLYESLIIEAIKIYGTDVFYIPRKIVKQDFVINEDLISQFDSSFKIEMYVGSVDGFEGDGQLLGKFGLEVRDQITLVVSSLRWNQMVGRYGHTEGSVRPREGDLIYIPFAKNLFEIKFVEPLKPFYQLKNLPTFTLSCELFEYESQEIDTGVPEIDGIQSIESSGFTYRISPMTPEGLTFMLGEDLEFTLPSGVTGSAEFFRYSREDPSQIVVGPLTFDDGAWHKIPVGTVLIGKDSGATSTVVEIYDKSDPNSTAFPNDVGFASNNAFAQSIVDFIDFSEQNPFGEPSL
jgi:hypothetical protein